MTFDTLWSRLIFKINLETVSRNEILNLATLTQISFPRSPILGYKNGLNKRTKCALKITKTKISIES